MRAASSSATASPRWRSCRTGRSTWCSPTRPTICSSAASCCAPTTPRSTRSTTTGTSSPRFEAYDAFTRAWLAERAARAEGRRRALGDRQLPQHLPRRRGAAGPGLLDPQRRGLAQVQPDAELQGHALHQRPRDADLGRQAPRRAALHLQLRRHEGRQRRPADALGLDPAAVHRRGADQGRRRAPRPTRPRSPRRCCTG